MLKISFVSLLGLLVPWTVGVHGLGISENIVCGSSIPTYVCLPRNYSSMDIPLSDQPNFVGNEN